MDLLGSFFFGKLRKKEGFFFPGPLYPFAPYGIIKKIDIRGKGGEMENLFDIHTHTLASAHAYSTLRENIRQAKSLGLKILGSSDHSKEMPGVGSNAFFGNYAAIPRIIDGVIVLCGVEANIKDYHGRIDIDLNHRKVDYAIVSLHKHCIRPGTVEENTAAIIKSINHPKIKIVGHPDDDMYPLDYEKLVPFLVERGIYAEVNNSSLKATGPRKGARENLIKLLGLGKAQGLKLVIGSDAHIDLEVGNISLAQDLLEEVNYPHDLILNYTKRPEDVLEALNITMEK